MSPISEMQAKLVKLELTKTELQAKTVDCELKRGNVSLTLFAIGGPLRPPYEFCLSWLIGFIFACEIF